MYELREERPSAETFRRLRAAAGMTDRSREAVERGLPNSRYAVVAVEVNEATADDAAGGDEAIVGMARVVGDGGTVYHGCDMAVHPNHQRQGLSTRLMDAVMEWITGSAPSMVSVNLLADVDGFYERWGFEPTAPAPRGTYPRR